MQDRFDGRAAALGGPAAHAFAVSPHDSNELSEVTRALYVGAAGNITCRLMGDAADVVFVAVPAGAVLPVRARFVRATGTSAASIVGLI